MKILNLYAGIGGNRKLWGYEHDITAVEMNIDIANIYTDFFPNDTVLADTDAHQYLLEHFEEYDFIWSSPPCPSHSRIRKNTSVASGQAKPVYPDMKLYEEILLLKHYFKGKWVVENVLPYYTPLIPAQQLGSHLFWSNFLIVPPRGESFRAHHAEIDALMERKGFDLKKYKGIDKVKALRNCVEPEIGRQILEYAINPIQTQASLV